MNGAELKRLREHLGLKQRELADAINGPLERSYTDSTVGRWENGARKIPDSVARYMEVLALETSLPADPSSGLGSDSSPPPGLVEDVPPQLDEPGGAATPPLVTRGGTYTRVCTELWEMVATGVGMVGAVTGSDALRNDGAIIEAHKARLGEAYGKLAETNETFRKMLVGMTTSGAWLEVGLVTGTLVGDLWRNHQPPSGPELHVYQNGGDPHGSDTVAAAPDYDAA